MIQPTGSLMRMLVPLMLALVLSAPVAAVEVKRVSANSVEAWLVEDHQTPIITVHVAFLGGAATDPAGKEGLAHMASALLTEGAGDRDAEAFHIRLRDLAVKLEAKAGMDTINVTMRTLKQHQAEAFALLGDIIASPRFDPDSVERVRGQVLADLRQKSSNPNVRANEALLAKLYAGHPYGRPIEGTAESVEAVTVEDLRSFVADRFARDAVIIGVVGDITAPELAELLDDLGSTLPETATPTDIDAVEASTDGRLTVVDMAVPQSSVLFAQPGIKRIDPDWYAALIVNRILGGGSFTSRLYQEVREKRGLVYSVYSRLSPMQHSALLRGGAGTANERVAETVRIIREEWARLADSGVTEEEVEAAKTFLTGSIALRFTSSPGIARMLVGMQLYDLGPDYIDRYPEIIEAVTVDDVNRVAKRLIQPGALFMVVAGQPEGLITPN